MATRPCNLHEFTSRCQLSGVGVDAYAASRAGHRRLSPPSNVARRDVDERAGSGDQAAWIVVFGPYPAGRSRRRAPIRSMCALPEISRRRATRCAPHGPCSSNGSIVAHSASLNQFSDLPNSASAPAEALNQRATSITSSLSTEPRPRRFALAESLEPAR